MTVIDIASFTGVAPSVSPRGLGADYSQTNKNLFLRSGEFWPLLEDKPHGEAVPNALALHRFQRNTRGELIQDAGAPLRSYDKLLSFVKGQINDEQTERTYYTHDDGSAPPRAIDLRGNDRVLGVPRPRPPQVSATTVDEFTLDEAQTWLYGEFAEAMFKAVLSRELPRTDEPRARFDEQGNILVGAHGKQKLYFYDEVEGAPEGRLNPSMLYAVVPTARVTEARIDVVRLGGVDLGDSYAIGVQALPTAVRLDWTLLQEDLLHLEYPNYAGKDSGRAVLTAEQAGKVVQAVKDEIKPAYSVELLRSKLDTLLVELEELLMHKYINPLGDKPVYPEAPIEYYRSYNDDDYAARQKVAAYEAKLKQYQSDFDNWLNGKEQESQDASALNARCAAILGECEELCVQIEEDGATPWETFKGKPERGGQWVDLVGGVAGLTSEAVNRVIDSRFYVVAMVTDWGEESEPSPLSEMLEVDANDTVQVSRPLLLSGETFEERHIAKWRLYRSNTSSTAAAWQLVAELDIGIAGFLDDKPSSELDSLQPQFTWSVPPYRQDTQFNSDLKPSTGENPYLRGMRGMPNGMMAGFIDNTVAFCEPYIPYAWPQEYQTTTEFPIVGLGVFGQTLFVGTTGNPYFISGAHSASMSAVKLDSNQSCMSGRSIIGVQGGVLYASPDGLCLASQAGIQCLSSQHIARDLWQRMKPSTMHAAEHENVYYLFYEGNGGGCLTFDFETKKMGFVDLRASAAWVDRFHDLMYVAWDGRVWECFTGQHQRSGLWRSSVRTQARQGGLGWLKVYGDQTPELPAIVRLYADSKLRHTAAVTSLEPVRLPPGRWLEYELEIESKSRLLRVLACTTTEELRSV